MATSRIDWTHTYAASVRVIPVVLIAGIPVVLVPSGLAPTTVAVTSGTIDPLFWPGTGTLTETLPDATTFNPVEDLLDPSEVLTVYEKVSVIKGDVSVDPLTFSLLDPGGRATALLSRREAMYSQQLASDITAASTSIPLVATGTFPTDGIASIGRETVTYSGIGGGSLVSVTRGKYGSKARAHTAPPEHRPLVTAGGARHWQGRVATVWLCTLSTDGTTLGDPSLIYMGSVGAGVSLTRNMTRWSVPLDHITQSLGRKLSFPSITLSGWSHFINDWTHPLSCVDQGLDFSLTNESGDPNNLGWHPDRESFFRAANARAVTLTSGVVFVTYGTDGRARVEWNSAGVRHGDVLCAWDPARWDNHTTDPPVDYWVSNGQVPTDCFQFNDRIKVPAALDFAAVPSTITWTTTTLGGVAGSAALAITADTKNTQKLVAEITNRDGTNQFLDIRATLPVGLSGSEIATATLCTTPTVAQLSVVARGDSPIAALKALSLALDAVGGQDIFDLAIDWAGLEQAFNNAPSRISPAREYRLSTGEDTFLGILTNEARLHGLTLTTSNGLLSAVRLSTFSDTEAITAAITETDLLMDGGTEVPTEIIDCAEPMATSIEFQVPSLTNPNGITLTVTDSTFRDEFGDGSVVKCDALQYLPRTADLSGLQDALVDIAQQTLGVLAEPSRTVRLMVPAPFLGLQPGNLISLTHSRIPTWTGVRGVNAAVCQIQEVRRALFGGQLRSIVSVRLQSGVRYGYAPEALVAAGGATAASLVVTFDTTTGWGASGFAPPTDAFGAAVTDPLLGFEVGHKVRLVALGTRTGIAEEGFTLTAVNRTSHTVTLDALPSSTMAARATGAYGVLMRFSGYGTAVPGQQLKWAWVANTSTQELNGTDPAKRWAS